MKRFAGFLKKEFYHISRDKRTLLILFGMPVVQILLFGFAITNEIKNAPVAFIDHARDLHTQQLINKIISGGYFLNSGLLVNENEIESAFKKGTIKEVIVFDKDFGNKLMKENKATMQVIVDASEPNTAATLVNYTQAITASYLKEINTNNELPLTIVTEQRLLFNPELKGVYMFVPGVITIILMLVSTMLTSISIAREKELGTMEVLMVSPLGRLPIILGKVFPYVLLSFLNANIILLLGKFVFEMPIHGSLFLLLGVCLLFVITALSLGILISTVAQTQQTAMFMSMVGLMLPTIMLSGFIFPVDSMPLPLQILSNIIPAKWFIIILICVFDPLAVALVLAYNVAISKEYEIYKPTVIDPQPIKPEPVVVSAEPTVKPEEIPVVQTVVTPDSETVVSVPKESEPVLTPVVDVLSNPTTKSKLMTGSYIHG